MRCSIVDWQCWESGTTRQVQIAFAELDRDAGPVGVASECRSGAGRLAVDEAKLSERAEFRPAEEDSELRIVQFRRFDDKARGRAAGAMDVGAVIRRRGSC